VVLEPGRGKTKTGRLWCYAVDDRPWAGSSHPAAAYVYSEDRRGEHSAAHLAAFKGILQVDGYAGFSSLVGRSHRDARSGSCPAAREGGVPATLWNSLECNGRQDYAGSSLPVLIDDRDIIDPTLRVC
jgi:hypothetical protein